MIVEDKVRQMIKLAIYDENKSDREKRPERYDKKDYMMLVTIKGFLHGTLAYAIAFLIAAVYIIEGQNAALFEDRGIYVALLMVSTYIVFIAVYMIAVNWVYRIRYDQGRKEAEEYLATLQKINDYYKQEGESNIKTPDEWK